MAKLSKILQVPVVSTQQVKFGPIAKEITDEHTEELVKVFEKGAFSMLGDEACAAHLQSLGRSVAILYGTVTEACILNTSKDLLDAGYTVFVVVDGISSF